MQNLHIKRIKDTNSATVNQIIQVTLFRHQDPEQKAWPSWNKSLIRYDGPVPLLYLSRSAGAACHWTLTGIFAVQYCASPDSPASVCRHPALCVWLYYEQGPWWRILSQFPWMLSGEVFATVSSVQTAPGDRHSVAAQCWPRAPHPPTRHHAGQSDVLSISLQFIHQTIHPTPTWLQEIIITHADFITLFQISIWSHLTGWM